MKLLTSNAKLIKPAPDASPYHIVGLSLAPNSLAIKPGDSVTTLCPAATRGCIASCVLWYAGRTVTRTYRQAAINRTRFYLDSPTAFQAELARQLCREQRKAKRLGATLGLRLNVASDLDWHGFVARHLNPRSAVASDYTKVRSRMARYLSGDYPPNYHLTYSAHEHSPPRLLGEILRKGGNVAQVFAVEYNAQHKRYGKLPASVSLGGHTAPVIDGDIHDIRTPSFDGRGVVVGLRLKGTNASKAQGRSSLFAVGATQDGGTI